MVKRLYINKINKGVTLLKNKITNATISIGIICLIMAFVVTLQIKSVIYNHAVTSEETVRMTDLLKQLNDERSKNENLNELVTTLKSDIQSFKEEASQNSDYSKTIITQLEKAELLAGLVEVEGSGVVVTLKDSTQKNIIGDANAYIIHDSDLLMVINELCDAGAEALCLNNERLISTSEVRCAGSIVSVNNTRCAQPFVIKAIGDPVNLENALMMRDGVYDTLVAWGLEIDIKKLSKITVPAYTGSLNYKFASRVENNSVEKNEKKVN